jgi:hypothetical protein
MKNEYFYGCDKGCVETFYWFRFSLVIFWNFFFELHSRNEKNEVYKMSLGK